ncbi:hypothetical protein ACO2RV_18630 [Ancylobacter sp. VNQ12]|uniref:hypothetical protein n=1 Tax=Ancylobacter sp. VNQ12 TaxID=3400920 RepID=UPI003C03E019
MKFDIGRVAAAEQYLDIKLGDLIKEAQSDTGLSLRAVRALVAIGTARPLLPELVGFTIGTDDLQRADAAIREHGIDAAAAAVGNALGRFLRDVSVGEAA